MIEARLKAVKIPKREQGGSGGAETKDVTLSPTK